MDWLTIVTSFSSSAAVAGAITYALKKSFDRALDLRFERLKEQNKALINEEIRRRGSLFDEQYSALKTGLALVYRLRNKARDAIRFMESEDRNQVKKCTREMGSLVTAAREILFEERATLPKRFFDCLHNMHHDVAVFNTICDTFSHERNAEKDKTTEIIKRAKEGYEMIDTIYLVFAEDVHSYLGVSSESSPRLIEEGTDRASLLP